MLSVGSTIHGWHVRRELHQGSMAITYEVRPEGAQVDGTTVRDGRYVLKIMFLRDPSFQERLRRVGHAQKGLTHPHLVDIIDVLDLDGSVAVISRYVEGTDLAAWAQQGHDVRDVIVLFRKLVDGLVAAHERGLVHRNLKPQKVRITEDGAPLIHDFMLGKTLTTDSATALTQMGTTFGTPQYMSPEQFRGAADVDARADLFSLGCLGFELLTGRRAFDGQGLMDIYKQVSSGEAPAPSSINPAVPPEVDALIAHLLAVDRDERPASARVVAERLDRHPVLLALQGRAPLDAPPAPRHDHAAPRRGPGPSRRGRHPHAARGPLRRRRHRHPQRAVGAGGHRRDPADPRRRRGDGAAWSRR